MVHYNSKYCKIKHEFISGWSSVKRAIPIPKFYLGELTTHFKFKLLNKYTSNIINLLKHLFIYLAKTNSHAKKKK